MWGWRNLGRCLNVTILLGKREKDGRFSGDVSNQKKTDLQKKLCGFRVTKSM